MSLSQATERMMCAAAQDSDDENSSSEDDSDEEPVPSFAELVHRIDVFQRTHNFTAAPGEVDGGASFETVAVATTSCAHGRRGRKCRAKSGHH